MTARVKWRGLVLLVVACLLMKRNAVDSSKEVMKNLTTGFAKAMQTCQKELNLSDNIMQDFYNFWKEDYELVNNEFGCAIVCMASKFGMVNDQFNLHHKNAHEFATSNGADDEVAKQVVAMLHECEQQYIEITYECKRVLETAKCFRTRIHALKWAPDMEVILDEIMAGA